jgi:Flp pilus assembly protein TadD
VWLERAQRDQDGVFLNKALEALGQVATSPDATSDALTMYGRALIMDHQLEAAEHALQQATTRYPLDPASLALYATVAENRGNLDASRQALIDYAGLVADNADSAQHAARVARLSMQLNDPQTAIAWLERALRAAPDDVRMLTQLADAQIRAGDRVTAEATIARALAKDPSNAGLLALNRRVR